MSLWSSNNQIEVARSSKTVKKSNIVGIMTFKIPPSENWKNGFDGMQTNAKDDEIWISADCDGISSTAPNTPT